MFLVYFRHPSLQWNNHSAFYVHLFLTYYSYIGITISPCPLTYMLCKYSETMARIHINHRTVYLIKTASGAPIDQVATVTSYTGTISKVQHSDCINLGSQIPIFSTDLLAKSADSISRFSVTKRQTNRYLHNITKRNDENWKQPRGKW
ncbi:MAG: hypothetical protein HMLIMOIP_002199 [Candidatus Nitrosomirales archaeon]|jgi:hypothetical protein